MKWKSHAVMMMAVMIRMMMLMMVVVVRITLMRQGFPQKGELEESQE